MAVPEVILALKDFVELVFFDSSFFNDCRTWEWALEENPSSQGQEEPCVGFLICSLNVSPGLLARGNATLPPNF